MTAAFGSSSSYGRHHHNPCSEGTQPRQLNCRSLLRTWASHSSSSPTPAAGPGLATTLAAHYERPEASAAEVELAGPVLDMAVVERVGHQWRLVVVVVIIPV